MANLAIVDSVQSSDVVEYGPACTMVTGKTMVERRLSVLPTATGAAMQYAATFNGKVGKLAREGMEQFAIASIARAARQGNYRPLSEALAIVLGETITITNRSSYESLADRFSDRHADLALSKNGGYTVSKKTGLTKPSAKRVILDKALQLVELVQAVAAKVE
jgi:hypothetical protein